MTNKEETEDVAREENEVTEDASDNESVHSYDSRDPNSEYYNPEHGYRKQPIEEVRAKVREMEQCYKDVQKEMEEMAGMVDKYKSLKLKCNKLSDYWYYHGPWTAYMDRMNEECPEEKYEIHGDNNLFTISHEFDELTLGLLRESALEVAKDV